MAVDPRFSGNEDKRIPSQGGYFQLEAVSSIKFGESADPVDKEYTASRWFELYGKTSVANSAAKLMVLDFDVAGASQVSPAMVSTLHVTLTDNHTDGHNFNGGEAIYAEAKSSAGTGADGNLGYITAIQARLTVPAGQNGYYGKSFALWCVMNLETGSTQPGESAFIGFRERGAVKTMYLLDTLQIASQSDGVWETDSGAVGTVLGYYKVCTAAGPGYLVVYADHS